MTGRAAGTRCGTCRAPVTRHVWLGLPLALDPHPGGELPRPAFCLHPRDQLRELYPAFHPPDCDRPHYAEHHCQPPPQALF